MNRCASGLVEGSQDHRRSVTWMRLDDPRALVDDTALLARLERLEAHARAAEVRSGADEGRSGRGRGGQRRPRAGAPTSPHEPGPARPTLRETCAAPPRGRRG